MAGADRVEGCLFGNGERTGNCDLVTVALNMYTQGVDPGLDFSDIDEIIKTVEYCNQLPVHPRHPYAGELVFTAFSGSHQDAIKKGFAAQEPAQRRAVGRALSADRPRRSRPQLRSGDPRQFAKRQGRRRLGARAGQGPQAAQAAAGRFLKHVQRLADEPSRELNAADIWQVFREAYFIKVEKRRFRLVDFEESRAHDGTRLFVGTIEVDGEAQSVSGRGNGLISSVLATLKQTFGLELEVVDYTEHAIGQGADAQAAAYVECARPDGSTVCGVGIDEDVATASVRAILSAANGAAQE